MAVAVARIGVGFSCICMVQIPVERDVRLRDSGFSVGVAADTYFLKLYRLESPRLSQLPHQQRSLILLLAAGLATVLYTRSTAQQTIAASVYGVGVLLISCFCLNCTGMAY